MPKDFTHVPENEKHGIAAIHTRGRRRCQRQTAVELKDSERFTWPPAHQLSIETGQAAQTKFRFEAKSGLSRLTVSAR